MAGFHEEHSGLFVNRSPTDNFDARGNGFEVERHRGNRQPRIFCTGAGFVRRLPAGLGDELRGNDAARRLVFGQADHLVGDLQPIYFRARGTKLDILSITTKCIGLFGVLALDI